jgi:hypothetical protein
MMAAANTARSGCVNIAFDVWRLSHNFSAFDNNEMEKKHEIEKASGEKTLHKNW